MALHAPASYLSPGVWCVPGFRSLLRPSTGSPPQSRKRRGPSWPHSTAMRGVDPRIFSFVTPTKVGVQLMALEQEAGFRLSASPMIGLDDHSTVIGWLEPTRIPRHSA